MTDSQSDKANKLAIYLLFIILQPYYVQCHGKDILLHMHMSIFTLMINTLRALKISESVSSAL